MGNEYANLENKVIIKSTSPEVLFLFTLPTPTTTTTTIYYA